MRLSTRSYVKGAPRQALFYLGLILIVMGLIFNKWIIEATIVPDGQIESSATVAMIAMIQAATVILGVYLAIRRPSIPTIPRELLTGLFISIISFGIFLVLAEVAARIVIPADTATSFNFRIPHPLFGWVLEPDVSYRNVLPEATVRVAYNSTGWRDVDHELEKAENVFRVLVLGDSFMEAYSVDYEDAFFRRIEKLTQASGLEVEVINLGVGGYGTLQEYLVFREVGRQYSPDIVLLGFYAANDVRNNSLELESRVAGGLKVNSRPFLVLDNSTKWKITQVDFEGAQRRFLEARSEQNSFGNKIREMSALAQGGREAFKRVMRRLQPPKGENSLSSPKQEVAMLGIHYCDEPEEYTSAWDVTRRILARLKTETDEIGSRLVVLTVPALHEVDAGAMQHRIAESRAPSAQCLETVPGYGRISSLLSELDIGMIDLLPDFRRVEREDESTLFWRSDEHWNPKGHALAAEIVASALVNDIQKATR